MSNVPLVMFLVFIVITLGITYWASKRSAGSSAYFAASRQIKGWQNGIAVAGDYMSAASFLGIAGIIAFQGYDGFLYDHRISQCAESGLALRNSGKRCSRYSRRISRICGTHTNTEIRLARICRRISLGL